jgi:ferric iron reductase protein FhuF
LAVFTIKRYNGFMTNLTSDQIRQLNMYSIYVEQPEQKIFTLETLLNGIMIEDALNVVQAVSESPNRTVAASYFMRRFGMFTAMQLYNLAAYDEVWNGDKKDLHFGAKVEYGKLAVSTFASADDWQYVDDEERHEVIRRILKDECDAVIRQIRTVTSVSPLTLWENIFGFLLWQYHVLLSNPGTSAEARADLDMLKDDALWEGIAPRSLFATYLKGCEPSALLNTEVRTTCCFSKDVPGLMQCGFCPLK